MISKDKIIPEQNHFVVSEKENRKIMPKNFQKDKSKKKLLDCTKWKNIDFLDIINFIFLSFNIL